MSSEKKILIVDDEDIVRRTVRDWIEDEGFEVTTAQSGEEGISILKEEDIRYCIVDMRLPGITGNDFIMMAKEIRPEVRCIIYTGSTDYVVPGELRALGFTSAHVFHKPVDDLNILIEALFPGYTSVNN